MENNIRDIFDSFGTKLVEDTRQSIVDKGIGREGDETKLAASVRFYYGIKGENNVTFNLAMANYWEAVNFGRGKNKKAPPSSKIKEWIKSTGFSTSKVESILLSIKAKNKGISFKKGNTIKNNKVDLKSISKRRLKTASYDKKIEALSWLFARSIGKKGTKATHFFTDILNDGRMEDLSKQVSEFYKKDIIVQFKDTFK